MRIYQIGHDEVYGRLASLLRRERVAIKKADIKTEYLGLADGISLVGVVGWQWLGDEHIRFKTDYIRKEYRGRGCYSNLWNNRWREIKDKSPEIISAYCTQLSIQKYIKEGFDISGEGSNGIVYVRWEKKRS